MVKNVVLLSVDALRSDHLSCYGYDRETTPNIDVLAEDALLFENAFSASSHTREAIPSMLTGRYPDEAITNDFTLAADTIASHLAETHQTAAFHSNPYVSRAYGFDRAFDHFYDDLRLGQHRVVALIQRAVNKLFLKRGEYHARAEEINRRSLDWIESLSDEQGFFLWNHYMDVHGPYNPPEGYELWSDHDISDYRAQEFYDRLTSDPVSDEVDPQMAIDLYDGEIRYTDHHIGKLVSRLRKEGYLENTLIIITSDHGDLFGEYGQFAHPRYLYPELIRVPLVVHAPDVESADVSTATSTLDILPSILDFSETRITQARGQSLFSQTPRSEGRHTFSSATGEDEDSDVRRFSVQTEDMGYRIERDAKTGILLSETLVRFTTNESIEVEDPMELDTAARKLRDELLTHSENRLSDDYRKENKSGQNREVEERLEALGYR